MLALIVFHDMEIPIQVSDKDEPDAPATERADMVFHIHRSPFLLEKVKARI